MTGNVGSDFRIKLLVVHPDGRRQKFLVTFPERRTLKIDQRYIGLPLTLRVDFVPGSIIARPGTGHTLSIAGKVVKEHPIAVNDVVGLDQYSIEFLELPEPLPIEEATRFVSISDLSEKTVVAPISHDPAEVTPLPPQHVPQNVPQQAPQHTPRPQAQPKPQQPVNTYQPGMYRADPEDSTAVIRRLQVPGAGPAGSSAYSHYANLQATGRTGDTAGGVTVTGITAAGTETAPSVSGASFLARFDRKHLMIAGGALAIFIGYMLFHSGSPKKPDSVSVELASQSGESGELASEPNPGELQPMDIPDSSPSDMSSDTSSQSSSAPIVPSPQAVVPAPVPMTAGHSSAPTESPFDDKSGFDPMAVDSFFDAVDAGDESKIKDLLDKRLVDINLSRRRGYAALHLAAARGDLATVRYLYKMKADPNVLDGSGATPLMWSVFRRHEDVVKFLAPKTNLKITRQGGETAYDLAKRMKLSRVLKSLDPEPKKASASRSSSKKRVPSALPAKKRK